MQKSERFKLSFLQLFLLQNTAFFEQIYAKPSLFSEKEDFFIFLRILYIQNLVYDMLR